MEELIHLDISKLKIHLWDFLCVSKSPLPNIWPSFVLCVLPCFVDIASC